MQVIQQLDPQVPHAANQTSRTNRLELFGFSLRNTSLQGAAELLLESTTLKNPMKVAFLNADCVNQCSANPYYRRVLNTFDHIFSDGVGMRLAAAMQGKSFVDNVNGTDLFPELLVGLEARAGSIFLLGGLPDRAMKVAEFIRLHYPNIRIAGHQHGYLGALGKENVIEQINASKPDILLVAMGAPKQEIWIAEHQSQLNVPVVVGVGGLFDYYSGAIRRAPRWMRAASIEWVWRLLMEPRAKGKRYLLGNIAFLCRALLEAFGYPVTQVPRGPSWGTRIAIAAWRVQDRIHTWSKRAVDVLAGTLAAILLSPVLLATALCIKLESPGPVLFSQTRVGKHGREFRMYKFRSMYTNAEARRASIENQNEMQDGVTFKVKKDPRITGVGRIIRKLSIDELPQLWNVLNGEMSLVGPRPPLPSETSQYTTQDRYRLQCKPGITCIWQVSGRSDIPFDQQVELDIEYIVSKSLWTDIKILFKTVPAVLLARGAY